MVKLTKQQVDEVIKETIAHCDKLMETGYPIVSVRGILTDIGYSKFLPQLLTEISERGFSYCLDHEIPCQSGVGGEPGMIYPDANVCYWGPDQISSRLRGCV